MGSQYGEIPLGLHVLRGENVVLMGEIDEARDPPAGLTQVSCLFLGKGMAGTMAGADSWVREGEGFSHPATDLCFWCCLCKRAGSSTTADSL